MKLKDVTNYRKNCLACGGSTKIRYMRNLADGMYNSLGFYDSTATDKNRAYITAKYKIKLNNEIEIISLSPDDAETREKVIDEMHSKYFSVDFTLACTACDDYAVDFSSTCEDEKLVLKDFKIDREWFEVHEEKDNCKIRYNVIVLPNSKNTQITVGRTHLKKILWNRKIWQQSTKTYSHNIDSLIPAEKFVGDSAEATIKKISKLMILI